VRCAKVDTALPTGDGPTRTYPVFVRKGSIVVYSISRYALHRLQDIYGPTATDFIPERWTSDSRDGPLRPSWDYIPFSGGTRICVGQQYALTGASNNIVGICQTFKEPHSRDYGPSKLELTLCSGERTKVELIPA
jgi:cytochrome P450